MTGPAPAQRSLRGPDPYPRVSGLSWTWLSAHGHCTLFTTAPTQHRGPLTTCLYLPPRASHQPGQREGVFPVMSTSS